MAGARSRENAANKKAVIDYNGTGSHRVSDKSVKKEESYSNTYGPVSSGATGEGHRKTKKMKGLWVLIFLIVALSGLLVYLLLRGDKSAPQIANEVTVDSTEASYQKRLEQEIKVQQRSQEVEPEPASENPEPAKKTKHESDNDPELLREILESPEDITPEWLESEQQLRVMKWRELYGPNSVYIEYREPSFEEILASNYHLSRRYRTEAEYM